MKHVECAALVAKLHAITEAINAAYSAASFAKDEKTFHKLHKLNNEVYDMMFEVMKKGSKDELTKSA